MRWLGVFAALLVGAMLWWRSAERPASPPPPSAAGPVPPSEPCAAVPEGGAIATLADHAERSATTTGNADAAADTAPLTLADVAIAPTVEFLVVDLDGRPIADAKVVATRGERDLGTVRTDRAGCAGLFDVPRDTDYTVAAFGFTPVTGRADPARAVEQVTLATAPRLIGRVFAPDGSAVAGARAALLLPLPDRRTAPKPLPPNTPTADTDATGAFAVPWPDEQLHDLVITAAGFAPCVLPQLAHASQGNHELLVTLLPGARIVGDAVDAGGAPLPFARLSIWTANGGATAPRPGIDGQPWRDGQVLTTLQTMRDGTFASDELPPGPAWIVLDGRGATQFAVLAPGIETAVRLLAVAPASVHGSVSGSTAGATVFLSDGRSHLHAQRTHDGTFRFRDLLPGRYAIAAGADTDLAGLMQATTQQLAIDDAPPMGIVVDLRPGQDLELTLTQAPAPGSIHGRAFLGGFAAAGAHVAVESVLGVGAMRREGDVAADGSFAIGGVLPGDYLVRLLAADDRRVLAEQPCRARAGDDAVVTLIAP